MRLIYCATACDPASDPLLFEVTDRLSWSAYSVGQLPTNPGTDNRVSGLDLSGGHMRAFPACLRGFPPIALLI